jgi:hypothetical protein
LLAGVPEVHDFRRPDDAHDTSARQNERGVPEVPAVLVLERVALPR